MGLRNVALLLAVVATMASAYYLPGTSPHNYRDNDNIEVQVNVMTSVNTHIPILYYNLPTCFPKKKTRGDPENLGEILLGDRKMPSPYEDLMVGEDIGCQVLCNEVSVSDEQQKLLRKLIKDDYHVNLIMDNLPLAHVNPDSGTFSVGVPLGSVEGDAAYLYNHMHFTIKYAPLSAEDRQKQHAKDLKAGTVLEDDDLEGMHRIISFVAKPYSIEHDANPQSKCTTSNFTGLAQYKPLAATTKAIVWSFGVTWEESDEQWQTRWDVYLNVEDHEIHWFSIMNSTLIVLFLSSMVAVILMRALRRDFTKYNRVEIDAEDLHEETGWKLVHKDVFRPPPHAWLLAALAGTGSQLLGMTLAVLVIACLGFLAPANRGALFTFLLVCFVFLGMYAGYVSARLLKVWNQPSWKHIFATGTIVPGIGFLTFFVINMAIRTQSRAGAAPFLTMVAVLAMWFCISLPLVFVGAVVGFKRESMKLPVATNQIPRCIPPTAWHMNTWLTIAIGGILPFGAVFIEVFFIFGAVWLNRYYYVFGFLMLVMIIMTITCAEITIVICYFQLCAEDYRWAWRSFFTSGSCGIYLFLYAVYYFFTSSLRMTSFVPILIYFGYMALLSFIFCVMTGTIGFLACFWFTRYIYGAIKVD
jgi:transmembrane 9 superfamily member 2/4